MQILLTLENTGIIDIPVNYNYCIQSSIFALLADEDAEYAKMLHNTAYGGKFKYKMFTFGKPEGRSHFRDKKLYYEGDIRYVFANTYEFGIESGEYAYRKTYFTDKKS